MLEHLKAVALQSDIGSDDTFFWYTSPSWMMWNFQIAGLLVGATIVCSREVQALRSRMHCGTSLLGFG